MKRRSLLGAPGHVPEPPMRALGQPKPPKPNPNQVVNQLYERVEQLRAELAAQKSLTKHWEQNARDWMRIHQDFRALHTHCAPVGIETA